MLVKYLHRSGVTTLNEPGAIVTPELLALYQSILGAESTPFSSLFIPDGRSIFERYGEDEALAATEKVVAAGARRARSRSCPTRSSSSPTGRSSRSSCR